MAKSLTQIVTHMEGHAERIKALVARHEKSLADIEAAIGSMDAPAAAPPAAPAGYAQERSSAGAQGSNLATRAADVHGG